MQKLHLVLLVSLGILSCTRHNPGVTQQKQSQYTVSTYATLPAQNISPLGVAVGPGGIVYASGDSTVWKIATDGTVSTLSTIHGAIENIACDAKGNVYVLERYQNKILKIDPAGTITTLAGGAPTPVDGQGTSAGFSLLWAIDLDSAGFMYVTDLTSIRRVDPTGLVTTVYSEPQNLVLHDGIVVDKFHNIYESDPYDLIRVDSLGNKTYLAGNGIPGNADNDGTGTAAGFAGLYGLTMDKTGNIIAADDHKIRLITPSGVVTTLAGTGAYGATDGDANIASFSGAVAVALDSAGNIFVADVTNHKIRKITHK